MGAQGTRRAAALQSAGMTPIDAARHHQRLGAYALALAIVAELEGAEARAEEARARLRLGQGRAALSVARRGVALDPDGLEPAFALVECLLGQGELAEARERAEGLRQREGLGLVDGARILDLLSAVRQGQGDPAAAIALSTRAVAQLEAAGADGWLVATALASLAAAQHRAGAYAAALDTWEELLRRRARLDEGEAHPERAAALDGKALTLRRLGRLGLAAQLHRQALATYTAAFGAVHPALAACHQGLAQTLRRQGDFVGARDHLAQALAISERCCGPDHTDTWITRFELGRMVVDCGDPAGGFSAMEAAFAALHARLGPSHPTVVAMGAWR